MQYLKEVRRTVCMNILQKVVLLKSKRYSTINENKIKSRKNLFFEKKKLIPDITNKILFAIHRRSILDNIF